MRRKILGFTLIELMIVVAIIAIIAAIAIPGLLRARMASHEGSASASLRSLASAEASFSKGRSVDQDNDGQGEYGVFNELSGGSNRRGKSAALPELQSLKDTDMSAAFQIPAGINYASKSGYYYQLFLPSAAAPAITDNAAGDPPIATTGYPDTADPDEQAAIQQQENRWVCYSWPASFRASGVRAFVCDQSGQVYGSSNTNETDNSGFYFGDQLTTRPDFDSCMSTLVDTPTSIDWQNISAKDNGNCVDTNHLWLPE